MCLRAIDELSPPHLPESPQNASLTSGNVEEITDPVALSSAPLADGNRLPTLSPRLEKTRQIRLAGMR